MSSSDRFTPHYAAPARPSSVRPIVDPTNIASASTGRRRKSRSPTTRPREFLAASGARTLKKKRSGTRLSSTTSNVQPTPIVYDDAAGDRGRKSKPKTPPATQSRFAIENVSTTVGATGGARKENERSRSREARLNWRRHMAPEPLFVAKEYERRNELRLEDINIAAPPDFKRMEKELESLKKILHEHKKTIKKQSKVIDQLNTTLSNETKAVSDKKDELDKLREKSKKSEELLSNIETTMQCQICMELLRKPYALPPCGHILCVQCLQEWFRQAPTDDDDMQDDDDTDYLLRRRKTCPCCRSVVRSRPVPVFLVKTVAATLAKTKAPENAQASSSRSDASSTTTDKDPWEGLFPSADHDSSDSDGSADDEDEDEDEDEDDHFGDDDDDDDDDDDVSDEWDGAYTYGSDSDDEPYDGEYLPARWEPPHRFMTLTFNDQIVTTLLRRGATLEMISLYDMDYTHAHGITALVEDASHHLGCVYLGWSIYLNEDDYAGSNYMEWIVRDIALRPERWDVSGLGHIGWIARKLVPVDEGSDYDTTDSEFYIADDH